VDNSSCRRSRRQPQPRRFHPCDDREGGIVNIASASTAVVGTLLDDMPTLKPPSFAKRRSVPPARLVLDEDMKQKAAKRTKLMKEIKREETQHDHDKKMPAKKTKKGTKQDKTLSHQSTRIQPSQVGINNTHMRRSIGHTRDVLNRHLAELKLDCFGQGVVSGKGGRISHLTLTMDWNDLPMNEQGRLQWYLGKGQRRLSLAQPLDPEVYQQKPLPIFWAEKQKKKGGSLCFYVGHFQCVRFEKNLHVSYKQDAQALLEFEFQYFDRDLTHKLSKLETLEVE